jgi:hypothetical protein
VIGTYPFDGFEAEAAGVDPEFAVDDVLGFRCFDEDVGGGGTGVGSGCDEDPPPVADGDGCCAADGVATGLFDANKSSVEGTSLGAEADVPADVAAGALADSFEPL